MCLEEMLGVAIPRGSLFYGQPHRREEVELDPALRAKTRQTADEVHNLIKSGLTPPPDHSGKCRSCSLCTVCLPKRTSRARIANLYLRRQLADALSPDPTGDIADEDP